MNTILTASAVEKYQVPSVESACTILRVVCGSDRALSMAEIDRLSAASRTTTMRIVSSLCRQGFLRRDEHGNVASGELMQMLSSRMHGDSIFRQRAVPILKRLAKATGETTHLAIPLERHCLLQEVIDSPQLVRVASRPGTLVDYHCSATGKVLLAFRNDLLLALRQNLELTQRTQNTICDWDALDTALGHARKRGYAMDDEEYHAGVRCIGAPVRGITGEVVAAIGVTGTTTRLTKRDIPGVANQVLAAAAELSETLTIPPVR